tara:strand:+ start:595 stop:1476 length:882 start_codon:yes stop_codon:yes gene_type:complete
MTIISEQLNQGATLSFEFFTPKDAAGQDRLDQNIEHLMNFSPDFLSITYGAAGTSRARTIGWVERLSTRYSVPIMPHLTCISHTKSEINSLLDIYKLVGVKNLLCLRGDKPSDSSLAITSDFTYASDLVTTVRHHSKFDIGVAVHTEGHPESANAETDLLHQSAKVAAADFAITQFFYESEHYEKFTEYLYKRGIRTPVLPGIMPATNLASLQRMSNLAGIKVPPKLIKQLQKADSSLKDRQRIAIETSVELSEKLLAVGAPGIHIYTLNSGIVPGKISQAIEPAIHSAPDHN